MSAENLSWITTKWFSLFLTMFKKTKLKSVVYCYNNFGQNISMKHKNIISLTPILSTI